MKPVYYASEIASLLGKHRFKPKEESLCRVLSNIPTFRSAIQALKEKHNIMTEKELLHSVPETVKQSLETAVVSSISSGCQHEIQETIRTFQHDVTTTLLNDALQGNAITEDFKIASTRIQTKTSTIEKEVERLKVAPTVNTLTSQIQKQRGTRMEEKAENESGLHVVNRNTPVRYESPHYIIVGYIDGSTSNKVVETKNRKHMWGSPPEYDLIQLRCYMKMKGSVDGILLERFPNGKTRETHLEWDDSIWSDIDDGLVTLSHEIANMCESDAISAVQTIFTKMDPKYK